MEPSEQAADNVLFDWQNRRLRLWLTSLRDCPDEFGYWAGLVRLRAQFFSDQWQPPRSELIERIRRCFNDADASAAASADGGGRGPAADRVVLPMAADALEADLLSKGVPRELAARARDLFSLDPPMSQWKI